MAEESTCVVKYLVNEMINFLPERERKLGNFMDGLILVLGDDSGFRLSVESVTLVSHYNATCMQSTVRKKMATGIFTYNALRAKTLKERIKIQRKIDKSNAVSIGTTAVKPYLSICPVGLGWFARYCGKMYSRHLFPYGG